MDDNKNNVFKIILIVLLVILLIGMAVIGYFFLSSREESEMEIAMKEKQEEQTLVLEEFVVNLKPNDKRRYLKATISLMFRDKKNDKAQFLEANKDQVRDEIISILREKTPDDFFEVETTNNLKEQIVDSINASLGAEVIEDIYFVDLVVQ